MALAISSSPSTTNPVRSSATTSGTDPSGYAITGVPHAIASVITSPNGSGQRIGMRRPRARAKCSSLR